MKRSHRHLILFLASLLLAGITTTLLPTVAVSEEGQADTYWTCGMHPQIVEDHPGTCPICGMDLIEKKRAVAPGAETNKAAGKAAGKKKERKILYWVAPMDPSYRSDKPGKSPMGMDLVPVYEDDGSSGSLIKIDPVVVQNMGVRIGIVRRERLHRSIRTVAQVLPAEDLLSVVNLRFSGWIEKIHADETGVLVHAGDPLFTIYSPELVSAQDELLVAIRTAGPGSALARSARRRLQLFGLRPWQIERIVKQKRSSATLTITAPRDGYVLHKSVVEGAHVKAGTDAYRIADLSRVWIEGEVYEYDAPMVRLGAPVQVQLTFQPGEPLEGKVSYIYPTLNERTRTLRVRVELPNPDLRLKPGSFATLNIESDTGDPTLVVPTESIIHSGTRDLVFVAVSLGRYEAREVQVGRSGDGYQTEIKSGLREGERVVTSGQFLLDSESQLQEAVAKMLESRLHAGSPEARVEGLEKTEAKATEGGEKKDGGYWTCGMHPQVVEDHPGTCPICGMNLEHVEK